eukprot:CAMPEP_0174374838 /NCGR_PEP_ID=MMETSP0811_2-20130205/112393_1 /TAXON_ID=73025 ORGANISM="Eutreptiella gymnastica-like, Strain CCMP1594" /NCGR_SAMPLE_ID=MMETSP0811_2 /ASSEMBLY_ACC=CAM_ASM_000667 /LENGTH=57 /DNA_ID=CAMNT_0015524505 /DNA_START=83 /DNA_END=253 /DNA_ORIENTATION=-
MVVQGHKMWQKHSHMRTRPASGQGDGVSLGTAHILCASSAVASPVAAGEPAACDPTD